MALWFRSSSSEGGNIRFKFGPVWKPSMCFVSGDIVVLEGVTCMCGQERADGKVCLSRMFHGILLAHTGACQIPHVLQSGVGHLALSWI